MCVCSPELWRVQPGCSPLGWRKRRGRPGLSGQPVRSAPIRGRRASASAGDVTSRMCVCVCVCPVCGCYLSGSPLCPRGAGVPADCWTWRRRLLLAPLGGGWSSLGLVGSWPWTRRAVVPQKSCVCVCMCVSPCVPQHWADAGLAARACPSVAPPAMTVCVCCVGLGANLSPGPTTPCDDAWRGLGRGCVWEKRRACEIVWEGSPSCRGSHPVRPVSRLLPRRRFAMDRFAGSLAYNWRGVPV